MKKLVFVCAPLAGVFSITSQSQKNLLLNEEFWQRTTVEDVTKILDTGADIEARDSNGGLPCMWLHGIAKRQNRNTLGNQKFLKDYFSERTVSSKSTLNFATLLYSNLKGWFDRDRCLQF